MLLLCSASSTSWTRTLRSCTGIATSARGTWLALVAGVGGAAARKGQRAITARVEVSSIFETPSRGSSTASAVLSSVCLSVCLLHGIFWSLWRRLLQRSGLPTPRKGLVTQALRGFSAPSPDGDPAKGPPRAANGMGSAPPWDGSGGSRSPHHAGESGPTRIACQPVITGRRRRPARRVAT